jgi:iron chelate uptake ABC transporter, feCT family, permease protein
LLTALTVGASLGLCGLITQTLFENPLADPSLFGIHAGAAVGAAAGPLIWSSGALLFLRTLPPLAGELFGVIMALCGALLVLALIVQLARKQLHGTALLVAGVMISFVLSSVLALMAYFSTTDGLRSFQLWTLGDFSSVGRMRLPLFVAALGLPVAYCWRQTATLDAWLLGENYARTLGIDPRRSRSRLLFAVGWITAWSTAFCGPVAFVGLAAPHAARLLCGTSLHRRNLPMTLAVGALLALACQCLCALPWPSGTLPLNAVTPLIGAPIVFLLLMRRPSH